MSSQLAKPGASSDIARTGDAAAVERTSDAPREHSEPRFRGKTFISDEVVSVIARIAAEQVEGIHSIGQSSFRSMFSRGRHHGVASEVGLKEAAVDIDIEVVFGYPIRELAQEMREIVIDSVERMTGRNVIEVNVNVNGVHVPGDEKRPRRQLE